MGRIPCCEKDNVKRGQWTPEEDNKLSSYIAQHGTRNWRLIPKNAGLQRCGKSCRLRWTNYLRPDLKHGEFSESEEQTIVKLHSVVGNRWSLIAAQLPGRTDNDVKNHWNTKLKKKLSGMGIDPVTHKPFSHLMAEIATTLAPPQVAHLAEAALGCFKDEMLHLLTKKRIDFPLQNVNSAASYMTKKPDETEETIQTIKFTMSSAMQEPDELPSNKVGWIGTSSREASDDFESVCNAFASSMEGLQYSGQITYEGDVSAWSQRMCIGSIPQQSSALHEKDEDSEEAEDGKSDRKETVFSTDCVLWDISEDMMNTTV